MEIISHRGFWKKPSEKNTMTAFERSFENSFGVETDVRDYEGALVISHDIPTGNPILFRHFLDLYCSMKKNLPLAINIKSDGLQEKILDYLYSNEITNYFLFDMSIPDHYIYIKNELITYTRHSDIEPHPPLYEESKGVWMDQFNSDWIGIDSIMNHIDNGKKVCIVSPELHGRKRDKAWSIYKQIPKKYLEELILCTDFPDKAEVYFND